MFQFRCTIRPNPENGIKGVPMTEHKLNSRFRLAYTWRPVKSDLPASHSWAWQQCPLHSLEEIISFTEVPVLETSLYHEAG